MREWNGFEVKEHGPLQYEVARVLGLAESVKQALHGVPNEEKVEILTSFFGQVEETLFDGSR